MIEYTDAELAELDLAALLRDGITAADGGLRAELQGTGSVAAAVQLDNQLVTAAQVAAGAGAVRGEATGILAPAVDHLVRLGLAGCATAADRAALARWLGMVANLIVLREHAREGR